MSRPSCVFMGSGACKGSGMIRFSTTAEATAAIRGLHHAMLPGLERPLEAWLHFREKDFKREDPRSLSVAVARRVMCSFSK